MNLEDAIKKMDKKELNRLFKKYNLNNKESLINRFKCNFYNISYLTDDEISYLAKGLVNKNIPTYLLENDFILNIEQNYVIPEEVTSIARDYLGVDSLKRKLLIVKFYLSLNGCIPIKELLRLCRKTGVKVSLNDLNKILDDSNYYIENNLVVSDENKEPCLDTSCEYYVYDIHHIKNILLLMFGYFPYAIDSLVDKFVDDSIEFGLYMVKLLLNGTFFQKSVSDILKEEKIHLPKKLLNEFTELIAQAMNSCPCSLYKGMSFSVFNGDFNEEKYYSLVDDLCNVYKIDIRNLLCVYLLVNHILPVDKFLKLLKEKHHIHFVPSLLFSVLCDIDCYIQDDYIVVSKENLILPNLHLFKDRIDDYKYISDPQEFTKEYNKRLDKVVNTCMKYGIDENAAKEFFVLLSIGIYKDNDVFNYYSDELYKIIPKDIVDKLFKELDRVIVNMPCFIYNGYSYKEIKGRI